MKTIVLCSSANFYQHVCEIADELEQKGFSPIIPLTARKMKKTGNFKAEDYRTWHKNPADFYKKTALMNDHFKEVAKADAVLVINDEKHGVAGYIGTNVLMEIAVAYYLNKPIFILNNVSKDSNTYEEIKGMCAKMINGNLQNIKL